MKASLGVGRATLRTAMALLLGLVGLGSMIGPLTASTTLASQKSGLVDDETYVSDTTGEEITWGGDWTYDEESSFVEGDVERLALTGDAGLLDVIYFPPGLDLASTRDDLFDLLTDGADDTLQIDRGDYPGSSGEVSYSLDKVLVGDVELAMFTLLMERSDDTFITVFYSTPRLFEDGMESAQDNIEIGGAGIFQGIKPSGLKAALDGAPPLLDGTSGSRTSTGNKTPEARTDETETPEAETTRESRSGRDDEATETPEAEGSGKTSTRGGQDDDATETPEAEGSGKTSTRGGQDDDATETPEAKGSGSTGSKKSTTGASDFEDLGVVGEGEYESPQYGIPVEWTDAWLVDESLDEPVISDTGSGTDQIGLIRAESDGAETYGALSVRFFEAGSSDTPESVVEYWTSKDYLNGGAGDGSTVLLQDATKTEGSVVLISELDNGDTLVQYLSVFFLDRGKTAVMIEFYSTDASIADAYADVEDGITVDGQPILTLFDARDIEDALADQ
ncbi:MAG: hypothetical protein QM753_08980 [Thermomicrobiales bacterium]